MNRNDQLLEFEERVDRFITNKLAQDQINELWIEVIEDKRKYEYLKTAAALTRYFAKTPSESGVQSINQEKLILRKQRLNKIRNIAAAAGISIAVGVSSVYLYSLESYDTIAPLATLDYATLRAATADNDLLMQADRDMQDAISLAQAGQFDLAIHRLQEVFDSTVPNATKAEVLMSMGIIEYNRGDFRTAERNFTQILADYPEDLQLTEQATWYLAQSQLAQGNIDVAKLTLQTVQNYGGAHSRAAERYLRYLR